ncbi:Nitrogen regulatory protein [Planctomycetes bacterium Pan216]|uniref:Nitrogen regulatory protein n=1 Tax=Kolteria novifilia TaxID=2527975 RepID=A0A518B9J7_9BACT|nr:Nitrogen regulatory protein [Planctomycetes bacterium Pan216]
MKLADFVVREAVIHDLQAVTKEDAVREIVKGLADAGELKSDEFESIVAAIMKREELGSTGIGNGVAVPHTKHPSVDKMVGTVAVSKKGLDFASIDREPVDIIFLLVSPPDRPGDHLRALENISRHLRVEMFCRFLRQAKKDEDIIEVLDEADANKFES